MTTKLPTNTKNVAFYAKGDFFLNKLLFESTKSGLFQKKASIERVSRLDQNDLQKLIAKTSKSDVIFFSKNIDHKQNPDWAYIKREKTLEKESFQVFANIYGVEKIVAFVIDFKQVSMFVYSSDANSLEVRTQRIDLNVQSNVSVNNFLFDPYVNFSEISELEKPILRAFQDLSKDLGLPDMVLLMGEFVWANTCKSFVAGLVKKFPKGKEAKSFELLIDENALWEGILSELPNETELKYLNKENFQRKVILVKEVKNGGTFKLANASESSGERIISANDEYWRYEKLESDEEYQKKNYKGILVGQGKEIRNFPVLTKIVKPRKDHVLAYEKEQLEISLDHSVAKCLRIFDYATPTSIDRLHLDVIEGEHVENNQKLAKYSELGGLVGKYFKSPIKGVVDLSSLKQGYIVIRASGKVERRKYKSFSKFRARIILGDIYQGEFDEEGVFISNLYKTDFESFVQKGKKLIVTDSIDLELFSDIVDFNLGRLATVVILGGINVQTRSDLDRSVFKGSCVYANPVFGSVSLGKYRKGESLEKKNEEKLRIGQEVRIIDPVCWGQYATIISLKDEKVGLKTDAGIDQLSSINLI